MRSVGIFYAARFLRLFAYGAISVILVLYLAALRFDAFQTGLLLSLTLAGDIVVSMLFTLIADRFGRRSILILSSVLMALAGVAFVLTDQFWILLLAATVGIISPSGNEIGPFLAIEQAALSQVTSTEKRTSMFARLNFVSSIATALGVLSSGWASQALEQLNVLPVDRFRWILGIYALIGALLSLLYCFVSKNVEVSTPKDQKTNAFGLGPSKTTVFKLAALFSLDAFAGGFVMQSLLVWWFHTQYQIPSGLLGTLFFAANVVSAASSLLAGRFAQRFGLINTMVFTHIPSNIFLILIPVVANPVWAIVLLLMRFSISQMDVPTRQAYTMAVVEPSERSAAAGITGIARTAGTSVSPLFSSLFMAQTALASLPFFLAGGLKIVYDLLLYRSFRKSNPNVK